MGTCQGIMRSRIPESCTMGLAKSSSQVESHFGHSLKGLELSLSPLHVFFKGTSVVCAVDAPIVPRVW